MATESCPFQIVGGRGPILLHTLLPNGRSVEVRVALAVLDLVWDEARQAPEGSPNVGVQASYVFSARYVGGPPQPLPEELDPESKEDEGGTKH